MTSFSATIRWIDRGIGVVGLAMIAASIAVVCVTWWDPASFAMAAIASLLGQRWVLGWLRRRHDGFHDALEADDTQQRLSERVDDDRPAPQDRDDASFANVVSWCKFLPTSLPDGWTRPISTTDSEWWHVTVGREKLLLSRAAYPNGDHVVVALAKPAHTEHGPTGQRGHTFSMADAH